MPYRQRGSVLAGHTKAVSSLKYSHDGTLLASASADRTVRLWDEQSGQALQILEGGSGLSDVSWSCDSALLCSCGDDKALRLFDVATSKRLRTLRGHSSYVFSVAFSPQGNLLASASKDETVRIWDVRSGTCARTLMAHSDPVTCVDFSADGTLIASCSYDGLCRVWDTASGQCVKTIIADDNTPVAFVKFTPVSLVGVLGEGGGERSGAAGVGHTAHGTRHAHNTTPTHWRVCQCTATTTATTSAPLCPAQNGIR